MSWGSKVDVEKAVEDMFGMKPEEVKAQLSKMSALESTVNSVKDLASAQTTALSDIKETLGKMSTPYSKGSDENQNENQNQNQNQYTSNWSEDADAAFTERVTKTVVPAILDTRGLYAKREAMDFVNENYKDIPWSKVSKEIDEKVKNSSLAMKASPEFWKNAYYVVVGELRHDIEKDKNAKSGRFYSEPASSSITLDAEDNKKPEDKLNAAQLVAAKKAGLSPADYAKELSSMTVWN